MYVVHCSKSLCDLIFTSMISEQHIKSCNVKYNFNFLIVHLKKKNTWFQLRVAKSIAYSSVTLDQIITTISEVANDLDLVIKGRWR